MARGTVGIRDIYRIVFGKQKMPTDYKAEILTAMLADLDGWGAGLRSRDQADWRAKRYDDARAPGFPFQMRHHGIPYRPRLWLDRPLTGTERQGFHHAVAALESALLLTAIRGKGNRVSHLQPSGTALTVAIRLVRGGGEEPDLKNIAKALRTTEWATKTHTDAIKAAK